MTALSVAALTTQANTNLADNATGDISALDVRDAVIDLADSAANITDLGATQSATGSGKFVLQTSPALVTPALGTPSSGNLSNCTALPVSVITGFGANVATFLATPSSANLRAALTDETGGGAAVFADTPTLVTPVLGTPTSGTLTNCTGLPAAGVVGTAATLGAANTFTAAPQTIAQGTITDPALNFSGTVTWNDGADTFTAWKLNVTDTASANDSKFLDIQRGGTSVLHVTKPAAIDHARLRCAAIIADRSMSQAGAGAAHISLWDESGNYVAIAGLGFGGVQKGFAFASDAFISFDSTTSAAAGSGDIGLKRASAGLLEVNSTAAGTLRDLTARRLYTPQTALTIASGAITVTGNFHRVDTESAAATDDLDTINGGVDGARLVLRAVNGARDVVVKDGTGNIQAAGDCTLDSTQDTITLIYDGNQSAWLEVARSNNGA